ncbi:hypothetical protein HQO38_18410 [Rhodococcus fascians]|nr:hypothetical protein [Rhodococcus fascians]MBY4140913.1 hypothetical protein [Rhodococcus fascians]MBY4219577.1 hypothetical protein [Rhodococcus fascians]MBY4221886.1 hypothetical protein [Rhodococcus fascians]MBY4233887.1 hypothetical protein [Rhodococcus fascians]
MPKALLLAWSQPTSPEVLGEFDNWYNATHAPQVCAAIGAKTPMTRYVNVEGTTGESDVSPKHLAIYEIEDGDVATANSALMEAVSGGRINMSPTLDVTSGAMEWYVAR